jgi:hypothetical protein
MLDMQVLAEQSSDAEGVMQSMSTAAKDKHVYAKQMGKFVNCIQHKWLKDGVHIVRTQNLFKMPSAALVPCMGSCLRCLEPTRLRSSPTGKACIHLRGGP